jgi:hypothetical protein
MIAHGAEHCPICATVSWQCHDDVVRWSKDAGVLEPCVLAGQVASVSAAAAQVLMRAWSLRIAPRTKELSRPYATWPASEALDGQLDCIAWTLDLMASWPGVSCTEDESRTILWSIDTDGLRRRLDDLQTRLEVDLCAQPGDLQAVPSRGA